MPSFNNFIDQIDVQVIRLTVLLKSKMLKIRQNEVTLIGDYVFSIFSNKCHFVKYTYMITKTNDRLR